MKILIALLAVSFFTTVLSEDLDETATTVSTISEGTSNATTAITNSTITDVTAVVTNSTTDSTTEVVTDSATEVVTNSTTEVVTNSTTEVVTNSTTEVVTNSTTEVVTNSTTAGVTNSTTTEVPISSTTVEPSSTTTEVPSNTTTVAPETTTTLPPVTPTVDPKPKKCDWNVTVGDVTCIKAEMKAQFVINIQGNDSVVNVGCHADLLGMDCPAGDTQELIISEDSNYVLTMVFKKDSGKFFTRNITLEYTMPDGDKLFVYNDTEKLFSVSVGNSYLCNSDVDVPLGNVTMKISDLHIQAFRENNDANFGTAEECNADDKVSDIIPIAVGVVLVALVLVVLIAYLIGRRRKSQKGYQTFQE